MPSYRPLILGALILSVSASFPIAASCLSAPDTITLNQSGQLFQSFEFNHAQHIQAIKECADCHHHTTGTFPADPRCAKCHANSSPTQVVSCKGCHSATPFSPEVLAEKRAAKERYHQDKMGLKGAMHQSCIGCHSKMATGPTGCQDCHARSSQGKAFYYTGKVAAQSSKKHH